MHAMKGGTSSQESPRRPYSSLPVYSSSWTDSTIGASDLLPTARGPGQDPNFPRFQLAKKGNVVRNLASVVMDDDDEALGAHANEGLGLPTRTLFLVFAVSGVSALLYQLIWQRALLLIYGSNIESVTMVVSAFMLGLGLGSLAGGVASKRQGVSLLFLFGCIEILIGVYGALSLWLFEAVGVMTEQMTGLFKGVLCFMLVLTPTLLMGSTLPLLVAHHVNASRNVGYSVSMLYFVNTLGAGIGALLAAFCVLGLLGLTNSVFLAVTLNVIAGITILYFWKKGRPS